MRTIFVNIYERDGKTMPTDPWKTRAEAISAGRAGIAGFRWVMLAKTKEKPVSGLRRPKWEDMQGRG